MNMNESTPIGHEPSQNSSEVEPQSLYFDPQEELDRLKSYLKNLDPEERARQRGPAFDELRQRIVDSHQTEKIASISRELEAYKDQHPHADTEQLLKIVQQRAESAQISPRQISVFKQKIDRQVMAEKDIELTVAQFEEVFGDDWPQMLFAEHFGFMPNGKLGVVIKGGSIIFEISSKQDWADIAKWREEHMGYSPRRTKGFMLPHKALGKHYVVGAVSRGSDLSERVFAPSGEAMIAHEQKHAQDFLLDPEITSPLEVKKMVSKSELNHDSGDDEVRQVVERAVKLGENSIFRLVKSEILAYFVLADYMFANLSSLKETMGLLLVNIMEKIKTGHSGKFTEAYAQGMQGEQGRDKRNVTMLELAQPSISYPESGSGYNYPEMAATIISKQISAKTGRDHSLLVDGVVAEHFDKLGPRIERCMEAAIEIIQNSTLESRETDWLLQNEPMQYWPSLAKKLARAA